MDPQGIGLAPHPVVCLVLQVGDAEKFPQALTFKSLDYCFRVSKQGPGFTVIEDGSDNRDLYSLNLLMKLKLLRRQILFSLVIAKATLMRSSAEQVPSLHRIAPRQLKLVTFSNYWPFILTSARMLLVPLVMILLIFVLSSISNAVALSTSLLLKS